jgi:hypothetical protein
MAEVQRIAISEEKKDEILNGLIDYLCDYGDNVKEAIEFLLDLGVNKEELLALNFDEDEIDDVLEETKGNEF